MCAAAPPSEGRLMSEQKQKQLKLLPAELHCDAFIYHLWTEHVTAVGKKVLLFKLQ